MREAQAILPDAEPHARAAGGQYLTFVLANEEFGVDILRVQEIRGWSPVTPLPGTPGYVRGVLNLRGTVVPIIDLRRRLGMEPAEHGPTTVTIVVKAGQGARCRMIGLVADAVSDVCDVADGDLKDVPELGPAVDLGFVQGMAAIRERMVILLDMDHLLGSAELVALNTQPAPDDAGALDNDTLKRGEERK